MIDVIKQMVEALEDVGVLTNREWQAVHKNKANDLRQAIKELESQEPVGWIDSKGNMLCVNINESCKPLYTHLPQRIEQEPVQVSPLEFVEMVMEKEHLIGKPIFWAEWPNKEKNT